MLLVARSPWAEKAEKLLAKLGKNPHWLARQLNLDKQKVYNWFRDSSPRDDSVWEDILSFLEREVALMEARTGSDPRLADPDPSAAARLSARAPLGSRVLLPLWRGALAGEEDEYSFTDDGNEPEYVEVPAFMLTAEPERYRLIQVLGSSMGDRIGHTDLVLVLVTPAPPMGSIVVVKRDDGQGFIKVLRPGSPPMPFELHSLDERFPPIKQVKRWEFIGAITGILKPGGTRSPNIEWANGEPLRG
jgi:hypothetical protein